MSRSLLVVGLALIAAVSGIVVSASMWCAESESLGADWLPLSAADGRCAGW
jgi:hypothetical protein